MHLSLDVKFFLFSLHDVLGNKLLMLSGTSGLQLSASLGCLLVQVILESESNLLNNLLNLSRLFLPRLSLTSFSAWSILGFLGSSGIDFTFD